MKGWFLHGWHFADHLFLTLVIAACLMASVVLTWNQPWLTTLLLAILLLFQGWLHPGPGDRAAMVAAALLGTPAEIAEVHLGEWTYHAPHLILGVPMWISLVWANLFPLFRRFARSWTRILDISLANKETWRRRFNVILAMPILALWIAALTLMEKPPVVQGLYALMILVTTLFWRTELDRLVFITGATLGAVGEFVSVQLGYWSYYNPLFKNIGVDITLPLDWGLSAVIIHRIASSWHHTRSQKKS